MPRNRIYGVSTIFPHVKAGKAKLLAVTTPRHAAAVPDWPTLAESGLPGFDTSLWVGMLAPEGMPKDIFDTLNAEVRPGSAAGCKETVRLSRVPMSPLSPVTQQR